MKLKITNKIAWERVKQHQNNDIELIGCKDICKCDSVIENLVKQNDICDKKNSFKKIFGFDSKFYYQISQRKNLEYCSFEIGLGHLEKREDKTYLKRIKTLVAYEDNRAFSTHEAPFHFKCYCEDDGFLLISNYNPSDLIALLIDKNCIISSVDNGAVSPVYIEKNSVIGRLEENIESLPITLLLNKVIKYEDNKVKFFTGERWINLVEEKDEDTK